MLIYAWMHRLHAGAWACVCMCMRAYLRVNLLMHRFVQESEIILSRPNLKLDHLRTYLSSPGSQIVQTR